MFLTTKYKTDISMVCFCSKTHVTQLSRKNVGSRDNLYDANYTYGSKLNNPYITYEQNNNYNTLQNATEIRMHFITLWITWGIKNFVA